MKISAVSAAKVHLWNSGDGSRVYSVIHNSGEIRYVLMEIKTEPDRQIGLVEDVTKVTRERMNIEHESDYYTLTRL